MAELKIIGVRRIEALHTILDAKYKKKISALPKPDIESIVDAEFGVTELRQSYLTALDTAKKALEQLNEVTGDSDYLTTNWRSSRSRETAYQKRESELSSELKDGPVAALNAELAAKKNSLWLCETLEEARAIVDGE